MWLGFDFEMSAGNTALLLAKYTNMAIRFVTNYLVLLTLTAYEIILKTLQRGIEHRSPA
jgi:hypothetical protein